MQTTRYKTDREKIEDALIAALFQDLIYAHIRQQPEVKNTYEKALGILNEIVNNSTGKEQKLNRRLNRICKTVTAYFVKNQFDTRKGFLCISSWVAALLEAQGLVIDQDSKFYEFLNDMGEVIQAGYTEIEDFEKIDNSAINHVNELHKLVQEEGYFV